MEYIAHLQKDKKLKKILQHQSPVQLAKKKKIYLVLCKSIMSQQLSTKVARVIHQRFLELYKGEPTAQQILDTPLEKLRSIGLSNAKANYIQNVARFQLEKGMDSTKLSKMDDQAVIDYLIEIKGVGRWTVEMLLMFTLGREDVFAADDLGIQNAMIKLYGLDPSNKRHLIEQMNKISQKWSPYRTYACMHLWQWKDNKPS